MLDVCFELLDVGYFEAKMAFDGLADDHVWKRSAEGLLSIGELAGHVAFWLAVRLSGEGKDAETDVGKCKVKSLLIDPRFRYLQTTLKTSPTDEQLAMTAEQVCSELLRVHTEATAHFRTMDVDLESVLPGYPAFYTYRAIVQYAVIHVAYHTGQIYTVRHLLGEETPDN